MVSIAEYFTPLNGVSLAGSANSTSLAQKVLGVRSIQLTMKKTGNSTTVSFIIYASPDGVEMDTEPYQTFTLTGAGTKQLTRPVTVGVHSIFIKAVNNDGSNACVVTAKCVPDYG